MVVLSDLRVMVGEEMCENHERGCACTVGCECERPASVADLVAVLEGLGAEGVEWCAEHFESAWSLDECWKQVYGEDDHYVPAGSPCRIVAGLVLRIEEEK